MIGLPTTRPATLALFLAWSAACLAQPASAQHPAACGEVITIATHGNSTTRFTLSIPQNAQAGSKPIALVLLAGGSGHVALDEKGCAQALKGNSLVRSIPLFHEAGLTTALIDAPSDYQGPDGLEEFRISPQHANDLGRLISAVRAQTKGAVWLVGTSRGSISAANAASRLTGPGAPDGIVLTSALTVGTSGGRKSWTANTVFDLPLESIRVPALLVGHAKDRCFRSPAEKMHGIAERIGSTRKQLVTVDGGPGNVGPVTLEACEGKSPHGYVEQEAEVAAGIARFIRGGDF